MRERKSVHNFQPEQRNRLVVFFLPNAMVIEKAKQARPHPGGSLLEGIVVQIPGGNCQVAGMSKVVFTGAAILKAARNSFNLTDVVVVNSDWLFAPEK